MERPGSTTGRYNLAALGFGAFLLTLFTAAMMTNWARGKTFDTPLLMLLLALAASMIFWALKIPPRWPRLEDWQLIARQKPDDKADAKENASRQVDHD